jgi:hypothetical protein
VSLPEDQQLVDKTPNTPQPHHLRFTFTSSGWRAPDSEAEQWPDGKDIARSGMDAQAEEDAVPGRRYEFRIAGRLSEHARAAFPGMDVTEVPAETVISGEVDDDGGVQEVLTLIQSLGLEVVAIRRARGTSTGREPTPSSCPAAAGRRGRLAR